MKMRPVAALLGVFAIGGAVVAVARKQARAPQRCPSGSVALAARCCGEGQHLNANRCVGVPSNCPPSLRLTEGGCIATTSKIEVAGGLLEVAPDDWESSDQPPGYEKSHVGAFAIDSHEVTEQAYAACVREGACEKTRVRGEPGLPQAWVTRQQAQAYCNDRGGDLPTSAQWAMAAMSETHRRYPWGMTGAVCRRAAFGLERGPCAQGGIGPQLGGMHPDGATPNGIHDLAGNLAEWTAPDAHEGRAHGGSWRTGSAGALRSWSFERTPATIGRDDLGFRCSYASEPQSEMSDSTQTPPENRHAP